MEEIRDFDFTKKQSVNEFVSSLGKIGVFGAGRVSDAADLVEEMLKDKKQAVFLCIAGPLIPAGFGKMVSDMVKKKYIQGVIVSGACISHDIAHAIGGKHFHSDKKFSELKESENAAGDLIIPNQTFMRLETKMKPWLDDIAKNNEKLCTWELIRELGKKLSEEKERKVDSFVETCYRENVPIFCPGIADSMVGFHCWMKTQNSKFTVDVIRDFNKLSEIIFSSKEVSAIILGGSLPKHYIMEAAMLKDGLTNAVQLTMDRPESGSLSGASLEEAKTWGKIKKTGKIVDVIGDATVLFPLIMSAVNERLR